MPQWGNRVAVEGRNGRYNEQRAKWHQANDSVKISTRRRSNRTYDELSEQTIKTIQNPTLKICTNKEKRYLCVQPRLSITCYSLDSIFSFSSLSLVTIWGLHFDIPTFTFYYPVIMENSQEGTCRKE